MLSLTRQRAFLASRRFPTTTLFRMTRPLSRTAETGAISSNSRFKGQRVAYVIGGTAIAIVALLYRKGDSQFPDDPRDVEALSTVPLSKLISGWTYVRLLPLNRPSKLI